MAVYCHTVPLVPTAGRCRTSPAGPAHLDDRRAGAAPAAAWAVPAPVGRRSRRPQAVALGSGRQAMAAQHSPHPVGRQADLTPLWSGELGGDPGWAEPWVAEGEGDHSLLDQDAGLVGHLWHPAFSWPQDLGAVPVQLVLPAVEGRGLDPHGPAGSAHRAPLGSGGEGP